MSGVKFSTYYCKVHDFLFGNCSEKILFSSCTTDYSGTCDCSFPERSLEDISIEKNMFWLKRFHDIESSHEYVTQPKAWVNINFTTNVIYPATSEFFILINGELQYDRSFIQAANNSSAVLILFGNEENMVEWQLYETFSTSSQLLNSGSFILNPKKFENLTYDLTY